VNTRTRIMWAVLVLCLGLFALALAEGLAASAITSALGVLGAVVYLTTRRARTRAARRRGPQ
jgi:hypothetical protein